MKKLLPGFFAISLITLPILLVTSCSSTEQILKTESKKLITKTTLIPNVSVITANSLINESIDQVSKDTVLETFYSKVKLSKGFNYTVKTAEINKTSSTIIDVLVVVSQIGVKKTIQHTIQIIGFKSYFIDELIKYPETKVTKNTTDTAAKALKSIETNIESLDIYYSPTIPLTQGFKLELVSGSLKEEGVEVDIIIKITRDGQSSSHQKITITGFSKINFIDELIKYPETKVTKNATDTAAKALKSIETNIESLDIYYSPTIPLTQGFKVEIVLGTIDTTIKSTLNLTIKITKDGQSSSHQKITITGFATDFTEELKKLVSMDTLLPLSTSEEAKIIMDTAESQDAKNIVLKTFYIVNLSNGFSIKFISSEINPSIHTTLNVTVKIIKNFAESVSKIIPITGFAISPFDIESDKLNTETTLITTGTAEEAKIALDDASNPAPLTNYYTEVTLSTGFTYAYTSSVVNGSDNTILNITVTITQTNGGATKDAIFNITGFAESTLAIEVAKFTNAISLVTIGTAAEAATVIGTDLSPLRTYYNVPTAVAGFTYVITATPTASNTTITVTLRITQTDGGDAQDVLFDITGFAE